jgi:hypothetical protein
MRKIVTLLLTLLLLTASSIAPYSPAKAEPRTIVVPDDYSTIQAAIDNATVGDTVLVRGGNYSTGLAYASPLNEGNLYIDKPIKLIGQNCQNTIINTKARVTYGSGLLITADNVTVSGFTIKGNANVISVDDGSANISNNIIELKGDSFAINIGGSRCQILSNTITGFNQGVGISLNVASGVLSNNFINGFKYGISGTGNAQIINNTLSNNIVGFMPLTNSTSFSYNNIINNVQNSIFSNLDINATYNWWGTTDPEAINQTIAHYSPTNFPLGNVTFIPFLTEPNPQAMPNPSVSITIPTRTPSPSPSVPEFPSWGILPLFIIVTFIAALFHFKKRKH